jgi:hypothetical protein
VFYVSVESHAGDRHVLALGPFRTHGAALAEVERVKRFVCERFREGHWCGFGTCRTKTEHPTGRFNRELSYQEDREELP